VQQVQVVQVVQLVHQAVLLQVQVAQQQVALR
jgi:hypothetical protein